MKKINYAWIVLALALFVGCSDNPANPDSPDTPQEASAEKQFVWNAMNYWYYWQADVAALDDGIDDDEAEFQEYLSGFSDAEALFESLRYSQDQFSFFIDDYEEFQNEQDGIYAALGFNYGFFYKSSQGNEVVGYIRYVIDGSPADDAGLERLTLFTQVDGTTITDSNYLDVLTSNAPHDLTVAHIDTTGGSVSFVEDSTVSVASEQVVEDPVFASNVIDTSGVKIGYLMYNGFLGNSHQRLNDVFGTFQSEGINELVLDLRYNGGGLVLTSQLLTSMISGLDSSNKFADLTYNQKRSDRNQPLYFLDEVPLQNDDGEFEQNNQGDFTNSEPMNSLSLTKLYVLTSGGTASASETTINGLKPYIDVEVIGLKTIGKDVGSLTFYDAPEPYTDEAQANSEHKKAIQPIVTKIVNSNGEDYPDGFSPSGFTSNGCVDSEEDNCVREITVENFVKKPAIGSPEEPLFARAIELILGQSPQARMSSVSSIPMSFEEVEIKSGIQNMRPHGHGQYLEPFMMPDNEK